MTPYFDMHLYYLIIWTPSQLPRAAYGKDEGVGFIPLEYYLAWFSLSDTLRREPVALDTFGSMWLSGHLILAGIRDFLLLGCGYWRESYLCQAEHFGPARENEADG